MSFGSPRPYGRDRSSARVFPGRANGNSLVSHGGRIGKHANTFQIAFGLSEKIKLCGKSDIYFVGSACIMYALEPKFATSQSVRSRKRFSHISLSVRHGKG